ncbi:MAG: general secretion pathway protein H [Halieaceae bacterium]|jgi:general secretion pathway protein H
MSISATGSKSPRVPYVSGGGVFGTGGFSLVELLVVLAIASLMMVAAVPSSVRFYDNMQARQAVRSTLNLLSSAREKALASGNTQDVHLRPATGRLWLNDQERVLPASLRMTVHGAAELNHEDIGVIRFYPDGSSSGGGVDLAREDGSGTRISVDWLVGSIRPQPIDRG